MTATSMMVARSPSGTERRIRACRRSSLSRSSVLAVKRTLYRAEAKGSTVAGRAGWGLDKGRVEEPEASARPGALPPS